MNAIEQLRQQLASAGPVPFDPGARGNFPYVWQDPSTLRMNALTYQWIDSSLVPGANPVRLGDAFTTVYTQALAAISFRLSSADQQRLSDAQGRAIAEQLQVLVAWKAAFGSLPPPTPTQQPIDVIVQTIVTTWADPPTSLTALERSARPSSLLNRVPTAGVRVVAALELYLSMIGETVPLLDAVPANTGRLQAALMAAQSPSTANGAIVTSDGTLRPAYTITPAVDEILRELDDGAPARTLHLEVSRELLSAEIDQLLAIRIDGVRGSVLPRFLDGAGPLPIELSFEGLATVSFAPVPFDGETRNWYWIDPIVEALRNGTDDVTGFFFSPGPPIDFGTSGPFAFLTQVVISKLPVITLRPRAWTGQAHADAEVELLSVPLPSYAMTLRPDGAVQLVPTAEGLDARAWVHDVVPVFPAASP